MDFKNYKLIEPIAAGAESVLYKARDSERNEFCVKAIRRFRLQHKSLCPLREREERYPYRRKKAHLQNEYKVSRSLYADGDESTVRIYHLRERKFYGLELGCDLLMEFLSGYDLGTTFVRTLPLEDKLKFLIQAAEAINNLHKRGYIHLDIKPPNFILSGDMVKIIDFGTTAIRGWIPGRLVGTPGYMPPEQMLGKEQIDEANDVFSFGVAANEVLGGKRLRQELSESSKRERKRDAYYSALSEESPLQCPKTGKTGIPPELVTLLRECTIPSKSKRYRSMRPVIAQLREFVQGHQPD